MLHEARWQVIDKLLQRLLAADFPPDLACDMVTLIEFDQPEDTIADIDKVVEREAESLLAIRQHLYEMLRRTMKTAKRPAPHLVPSLLDIMLRNVAKQYRISLSA